MKKILFLLMLIAWCNVAAATTKCIKIPSSCYGQAPTTYGGAAQWLALCDSTRVTGVGACSSIASAAIGDAVIDLVYSSDLTKNVNCYCKMTKPVLSYWIYHGTHDTAANCLARCTNYCSVGLKTTANYRNAMFSNISSDY